jgi:hypothetical protein
MKGQNIWLYFAGSEWDMSSAGARLSRTTLSTNFLRREPEGEGCTKGETYHTTTLAP